MDIGRNGWQHERSSAGNLKRYELCVKFAPDYNNETDHSAYKSDRSSLAGIWDRM